MIIRKFSNSDVFTPPKLNPGVFIQDPYVGKAGTVCELRNRQFGMIGVKHFDKLGWNWPDFCIGIEYEIEVIPDEIDLLWNKQL